MVAIISILHNGIPFFGPPSFSHVAQCTPNRVLLVDAPKIRLRHPGVRDLVPVCRFSRHWAAELVGFLSIYIYIYIYI